MNLRERKKLAVWRTIRSTALRLFDERGFEAVSVEEIAAASDVSRSTFFNYFASKEAVVFDQDPEELDHLRALIAARPAEEPLWDSLTAILIGFNERLGDRMPLQRRLKVRSPALARSTKDLGEQFFADFREWTMSRAAEGETLTAILQFNLAVAAQSTAYQTWHPDESFDSYLERLKYCLRQARNGVAASLGSAPSA
jgi:AcrR family transcriptional regulator